LKIYISQGSVATQLRCGGIINYYYKFSPECSGEKILKIGQYLAKVWTKVCGLVFLAHPVYVYRFMCAFTRKYCTMIDLIIY